MRISDLSSDVCSSDLAMDWVNLFAMAVNEENAASGRVVTAPTNGAAGLLPAVLRYYQTFIPGNTEQGVIDFLLPAAAGGFLYKENADRKSRLLGRECVSTGRSGGERTH